MSSLMFTHPLRLPAGKPKNIALTYGVAVSLVVHVLAATAVFSVAVKPPTVPSAPIVVSMISEPAPESIQAKPAQSPRLRPVKTQPLPALAQQAVDMPETPASQAAPPTSAVLADASPALAVVQPRFDAAYLDNPAPSYPPMSRRMGEQGRVLLRVLVNADGSAAQVELKSSSGSPRLDQSALDTVKRWRFIPAKQGTQAIAAWVLVPVSFTLGA